MTFRNSVIIF